MYMSCPNCPEREKCPLRTDEVLQSYFKCNSPDCDENAKARMEES